MKKTMKLALALAVSTAMTGTANAATRTFTISNGTFTDGGTFGGSFDYNDIGNRYFNLNIFSKGGDFNDHTYTDRDIDFGGGNYIVLDVGDGARYFNINFTNRLVDVVDPISFRAGSGYELNSSLSAREIYTGTLAIAAIPESSTWLMMLVGFSLIGGATRYRRRTTMLAYA